VAVFVAAFVICLIIGPVLISLMTKLRFGQTVRDDGPSSHFKKNGTPIMGAFIFIIPITIISLFLARIYSGLIPLILVTLAFGGIGFIDDFIKVASKRKDGLYAKQKTFLQLLVATVFAVYIGYFTKIGTGIFEPFSSIQAPTWH